MKATDALIAEIEASLAAVSDPSDSDAVSDAERAALARDMLGDQALIPVPPAAPSFWSRFWTCVGNWIVG